MRNSVTIIRHYHTDAKPYLDTVKTWSFCDDENSAEKNYGNYLL